MSADDHLRLATGMPEDDPDARLGGNDTQPDRVPALGRRYEVQQKKGDLWLVLGVELAGSAREAIRQAMERYQLIGNQTMRAVPQRYVTEVSAAVEIQTKLVLS